MNKIKIMRLTIRCLKHIPISEKMIMMLIRLCLNHRKINQILNNKLILINLKRLVEADMIDSNKRLIQSRMKEAINKNLLEK